MRSPKISQKESGEIFNKNVGGRLGVGKNGGFRKKGEIPDFFTVLSTKLIQLLIVSFSLPDHSLCSVI